jgi:hypothetical protein
MNPEIGAQSANKSWDHQGRGLQGVCAFTPLQAAGIAFFQVFGLVALLAIIAGVLVISASPMALAVMSIAFAANVLVIVFRLYWRTAYDLHIVGRLMGDNCAHSR